MTLTTHHVLRDYLAVKYGGKAEYRLPNDLVVDVLVKQNDRPDRLIEIKGLTVAPSQAKSAAGQLLDYRDFYKTQHPDREVALELHWILPRNPIARAAEQARLARLTTSAQWQDVTIYPVIDRPVPFIYQLGHMAFASSAIAGDIGDYCRNVVQEWQECGLIRDEDRAALLALAKATWPLARAVELDQGVWFILNGQANPVTKSWGPLVKQWIAKVHHRWWSVAALDDSLEG